MLQYHVSLPVLLLLCFFHAVAEALPPLIFLPPLIPLLLTFELCTERWETWPCLPGRLTKAAAATALCSWEEEEKEWGTPLTPPWDSWPWELCGREEGGGGVRRAASGSVAFPPLSEELPPTCLMEWCWMMLAPWPAWWWCCREEARAWTCFSCWDMSCSALSDEEDDELPWEADEDVCW